MHHHDALAFLPRAPVRNFAKGHYIYDSGRPSLFYLVLSGTVRLNCTASNGSQSMIRIVPPEGFFGESSLVPHVEPNYRETAISVSPTQLMSWNPEEVESHIERQPRLSLALCEYFGHCNEQVRDRIVTTATQNTGTRVKVALIQMAREIGEARTDGACRVVGITHRVLAEYIGSSREIVTGEMNRLRAQGYVQYSRRYIDVYTDALAEYIRTDGLHISQSATGSSLGVAD